MTEARPFSPERFDPFHIPGRVSEVGCFLGAVTLLAVIFTAPFYVPLSTEDMFLLLGLALFASMFFYRGLQARRHRILRMQKVAELKTRLLSELVETASN